MVKADNGVKIKIEVKDDGARVVKRANGSVIWTKGLFIHREDGPARIYPNGRMQWRYLGKLHRLDGPADIWPDGPFAYYLWDICYSREDWFERLTPEQKIIALCNPENF